MDADVLDDDVVVREGKAQVRIRGKNIWLPAARVDDSVAVVNGRVLRVASIKDEMFLPDDRVPEPAAFAAKLRRTGLRADVLTFIQKPPLAAPAHPYPVVWENLAVVPTEDPGLWWKGLRQETRKNVRRAESRGVEVRTTTLDDDFVRQVKDIYDEAPLRQGKPFYHYKKDLAVVAKELGTFAGSSEFVGAYCGGELIGFVKMIHMGALSSIMHIVSKNAHADKRPMNALLAHLVHLCHRRGAAYLVYGNYLYGRKGHDSLAEFKRRNGFVKLDYPRYFMPMTVRGEIGLRCSLHREVIDVLPRPVIALLLKARAMALRGRRSEAEPNDVKADG